jgi:hypothetical protein
MVIMCLGKCQVLGRYCTLIIALIIIFIFVIDEAMQLGGNKAHESLSSGLDVMGLLRDPV